MKRALKQKRTRQLRKARTRARIFGTQEKPRLSVFRSNRYVWAQLIDDAHEKTLAAATSRGLVKTKKTEAAKKVGEMIAEKAKALKISAAVFDRGEYRYHGRLKAVAEGARAGGLKL